MKLEKMKAERAKLEKEFQELSVAAEQHQQQLNAIERRGIELRGAAKLLDGFIAELEPKQKPVKAVPEKKAKK